MVGALVVTGANEVGALVGADPSFSSSKYSEVGLGLASPTEFGLSDDPNASESIEGFVLGPSVSEGEVEMEGTLVGDDESEGLFDDSFDVSDSEELDEGTSFCVLVGLFDAA